MIYSPAVLPLAKKPTATPAAPAAPSIRSRRETEAWRCARGRYVDRGPAFPTGKKGSCELCKGRCWNRGCSECSRNFHKTCYFLHRSRAGTAPMSATPSHTPEELERDELRPFLRTIGMEAMAENFTSREIFGHQDLLREVTDEFLTALGCKTVQRRKVLKAVAELQSRLLAKPKEHEKGGDGESERTVRVERETPEVSCGMKLTMEGKRVALVDVVEDSPAGRARLTSGMKVVNVNGTPVASREAFMAATKGKTSFYLTVRWQREGPVKDPEQKGSDLQYRPLRCIGTGRFSRVYLVQKRSGELFAKKMIDKRSVPEGKLGAQRRERDMMLRTSWSGSPFIVRLHHTYQTERHLCFIMDYCAGGDLYDYLGAQEHGLSEDTARYYAAQIFQGLVDLHSNSVFYRNLKPENVLLDATGNARLGDFSLSRPLAWGSRAQTIVGANAYIAPEILQQEKYSFAADWWSFGVLIFFMLTGRTPFAPPDSPGAGEAPLHSEEEEAEAVLLYARTEGPPPQLPAGCSSFEAQSLLDGLLERDPSCRLEGGKVIRKQPWFKHPSFDFDAAVQGGGGAPPNWTPPQTVDVEELPRECSVDVDSMRPDRTPIRIDGFSFGGADSEDPSWEGDIGVWQDVSDAALAPEGHTDPYTGA
eukprot:Hpha_TRINITY_DN14642_c0_g2::TRINITY_DN14642_c0_g2_i1::g.48431::m.48431/K04373/RPS6KA; ribosomal protein S6 kinase alpha-1/2/3/6